MTLIGSTGGMPYYQRQYTPVKKQLEPSPEQSRAATVAVTPRIVETPVILARPQESIPKIATGNDSANLGNDGRRNPEQQQQRKLQEQEPVPVIRDEAAIIHVADDALKLFEQLEQLNPGEENLIPGTRAAAIAAYKRNSI